VYKIVLSLILNLVQINVLEGIVNMNRSEHKKKITKDTIIDSSSLLFNEKAF
jgi:hypothetical protein